jgi:RNA exonuclease 1
MVENDYPIPSYMADVFEKPPDWIEIPEPKATGHEWGPPKVYAIDCEMVWFTSMLSCWTWTYNQLKCVTEDGKELTRVCVIDFASGIVVFDQLVKPSKPILDYLTRQVSFVVLPIFTKIRAGGQELRPRPLPP